MHGILYLKEGMALFKPRPLREHQLSEERMQTEAGGVLYFRAEVFMREAGNSRLHHV